MSELKRITFDVHVICSVIACSAFGLACWFGSGPTRYEIELMVIRGTVLIFSGEAWLAGIALMFLKDKPRIIPLIISTVGAFLLWVFAVSRGLQ